MKIYSGQQCAQAGIQVAYPSSGNHQSPLDSRLRALLSGINDEEQQESVVQTGETGLAILRRLNCVIPREVAESMRRILIDRRMDSATTLRSAQNDNLLRTAVRLRGNDDLKRLD